MIKIIMMIKWVMHIVLTKVKIHLCVIFFIKMLLAYSIFISSALINEFSKIHLGVIFY